MNGNVSHRHRMFVYVFHMDANLSDRQNEAVRMVAITGGSKSELMRWMARLRKSNGLESFFPT